MPLTEGANFAGFTIIRSLGSGGMGEVYLAQHPRLPRREALKLLPSALSYDPQYRERFDREADLASTLYHPNIVGVHDRGESAGQLWISMDYVDGQDAGRLLTEHYLDGMSLRDVVAIVTAVADALDYAHARGLLHRDVKPSNILVTDSPGRRIVLADFGIARRVDDDAGITQTNMTVGTIAYAAPEQLMGGSLDGRADQYALAATAFHLLSGSPPFPQSNAAVMIVERLKGSTPRIGDSRPDLVSCGGALARAMSMDPKLRFSSCAEFAEALARGRLEPVTKPLISATTQLTPEASPTLQAPVAERWGTSTRNPHRKMIALGALTFGVVGLLVFAFVAIMRAGSEEAAPSPKPSAGVPMPSSAAIPSTGLAPSSTTAEASANETIDDYLKANGIQQTLVKRGDPGTPELGLPTPPGWRVLTDSEAPQTAWGAIVLDDPAAGSNPPAIIATMAKLTGGNPDPATLMRLAPNKVRSLPEFDGPETGQDGQLAGFQASTIGGTFVQDGVNMLVARKTVVIPAKDATYLLALDVQGNEEYATQMMDATAAIDEGTTITVP
ncbi:LpqN/LpqT family lipoprotein [Mycolicibacterium arenosum]|uniref:non-specific serine/threonine protein kinase n=1 Tax=Mycolicibacterium arenosum TaxID=2952157 RepID=A0ABT1MB42_9MYCO|nr:LpqN/LpqT family lipoprotein [Mycolicibacterium sp. CAU 1645]MCP9275444.1 LpqN/LpqT family lipoprotein [Mycolicibacterium sp. CAU 1645]